MVSHQRESSVVIVSVVAAVRVAAVPPDCSWGSGASYPDPLQTGPPYLDPVCPYLRIGGERGRGRRSREGGGGEGGERGK